MNQTTQYSPLLNVSSRTGEAPRVAIISAMWHREVVHRCRDAARETLLANGLPDSNVGMYDVPGAFEIPLFAKQLARTNKADAIIACAFVVDGGIYRHDFVASAVIDGLMRVQLDTDVPVFSAVLTPHQFHEHNAEHQTFFEAHFALKGKEVAQALTQVLCRPAS
jgi:6,7-dimethyl-8-ribityllumazine synthase